VNIFESGAGTEGTLVQVFPNGNQRELAILGVEINGPTLSFQTDDQGTKFNWRLTVKNGSQRGLLHGTEGSPAAGRRGGELVIEMPVKRVRHK
jgi:hypothetical protein